MPLITAVGNSTLIKGREAGFQAVEAALEQVGRQPVVFGCVVSSYVHPIDQVLSGVVDLLGDAPLLGFSSSAELTTAGLEHRSVAVALLCGEGFYGRANWWPDFASDNRACTRRMLQELEPDSGQFESLLVAADGLNGDAAYLCQALSEDGYPLAGCLAGGNLQRGRTFQIGGRGSGSGGLAAAVLGGDILTGVGSAHGWQLVGAMARLTRVQGQWVREIDGQPPNHLYARLFGYAASQWVHPPLNEMVRLYPLGVHKDSGLVVRSPLWMEADGSLRMNTELPEGSVVDLLVGTQEACLKAAHRAAEDALASLGPIRPKLALLLVDEAWPAILELRPGAEVEAVRSVVGNDVPVLGGYSFGQIARLKPGQEAFLLNQHILVVLFGEKQLETTGETP
jgi:hypothetical protein